MALAGTAAISTLLAAGSAGAANGAYAVDAADISDVGSCKVESWISTATNTDFSAVANPSCVANIFKPVELSLLTNRSRSDGDWSTSIAPKAKWNIVPTGIGKFGFSFYAGGSFDALTGDNLTAFAVVWLVSARANADTQTIATSAVSVMSNVNVNASFAPPPLAMPPAPIVDDKRAPLCDPRGAITFASAPQMQEVEVSLDQRGLGDHRDGVVAFGEHLEDASGKPVRALDLAREAAGGLDVRIGGGPTVFTSAGFSAPLAA